MKKYICLIALVMAISSCNQQQKNEIILPEYSSPKMMNNNGNPLLDFNFNADPTAVEHEGRLYVYATNDHQQLDIVGPEGNNGYQHIHSLVMMSTDDMVNWTFHGYIDVKSLSPWGIASWAPSITKRVEADGKTHFYLYYSNCGVGVGMLTATSPVGPWTDPLGKNVVDKQSEGLGNCGAPFDPGVVVDDEGRGWLSFGGGSNQFGTEYNPGNARIVRLADDMMHLDSPITEIKAPYHFEANELNYINGTWVYTYNTSWVERKEWPLETEKPSICCMSYMTSKTPLDTDSWEYQVNYFKNPMDYGFLPSNNHTHLHKFQGEYYLLYHTLVLEEHRNGKGGFRSVCIDKIKVDEENLTIHMGEATRTGVDQLKPLYPFNWVQAETVAATHNIRFVPTGRPGDTAAACHTDGQILKIRGVDFHTAPQEVNVVVRGPGKLTVRLDHPKEGQIIANLSFEGDEWKEVTEKITVPVSGQHDLFFITSEGDFQFDKWKFIP
ncbi:MAG: beta-xylosidase [Bacteroides sp.]|nr:beta-xylosidase [Bacteroides sp.]